MIDLVTIKSTSPARASDTIRLNALLCDMPVINNQLNMDFLSSAADKDWDRNKLLLLLVSMDQVTDFLHSYDAENRQAIEQSILGVFERLEPFCFSMNATPMNGKCQALMLLSLKNETQRSDLLSECRDIQKEITQLTEQTVTITLGIIFEDAGEVSDRFPAIKALSHRRVSTGWNSLLDELKPPKIVYRSLPEMDYHALKNAFISGQKKLVTAEINQYTQVLPFCSNLLVYRQSYYTIYATLQQIASELLHQSIDFQSFDEEPETALAAIDTMKCVSSLILDCFLEEKNKKRYDVAVAAMDYLEDHYMDSAITIDTIVEALNISRNYLTQCFKEKFGNTIPSALDDIRMKKAKELLTTTEQQVKDIVRDVGYIDVNNFIRKFRKHETITPLQYRKAYGVGLQHDES